MIELSNRLGQIARMVQPGSVVADIGTDHGQLMVYLAQNGTIRRGYACDINEKPLNKARQIIADYGLEDRIECVLASGLDGLQPGSVDTVVIAGMGGDLTARILDAAPWVREYHTRLLLQPMTKPDHLREYLCREGFRLELENAVISGKFVYTPGTQPVGAIYRAGTGRGFCRYRPLSHAHPPQPAGTDCRD